jgi:PAS domain S-box-containing protein
MTRKRNSAERIIEELERSRQRLELAQKAAKIGVYEWDLLTDEIWFSEQASKLFGRPDSHITKREDLIETVHPDDQSRVNREIEEAIAQKLRYEGEFRIVHPDGSLVWLKAIGRTFYKNGKAMRMVGINYDVTSRKLNEELLRFKAEASRVLSSSLNYRETLKQVAQIAIDHIADWCTIDMLTDDSQIELLALAHKDSEKVKWAKEYREANPVDMQAPTGMPRVLRTGKPEIYPKITKEMIRAIVKDKKELALLESLGFSSVLVVPIKVKKKTIGAMTLISAESQWHYDENTLEMATQLATRAAMAIENAQLYERVESDNERMNRLVANVPGIVWESWTKKDETKNRVDFVSE